MTDLPMASADRLAPEPAAPARDEPGIRIADGDRPMWRLLLAFMAPLVLGNLLQSASVTIGNVWTGRLISTQALGAVTAAFPVVILLVSSIVGVAGGGTVLVAQAYGARDLRAVKRIAGTLLAATMLLSIVIAVAGPFGSGKLLALLGTPGDILGQARAYVDVVFVTMPVLAVYAVYTTLLNGTGDTRTPLHSLILATVLAAAITPCMIVGAFGLPRMGVASIAAAGAVGNGVAFVWLLLRARNVGHPLQIDREMLSYLRFDRSVITAVLRIGVPSTIQGTLLSFAEIAVLFFINQFGSAATAAYGAVIQVASYAQFPGIAVGIATSVFAGQLIGANREERSGDVVRAALGLNYAIAIPLIVVCYLCAWSLLGIFITDSNTLRIAHEALMLILWSIAIYGNTAVVTGAMRGSGDVLWPSIISVASVWGVEVPVAYVLMHRIGLDGVWIAGPIGLCAALLLQLAYYQLVWKRNTHERLV